jgi:hypothetical protein
VTYVVTTNDVLSRVAAPRLPNAPVDYNQQFGDQLTNTLRLYFNRLDNILGQLQTTAPVTVANLPSASIVGAGSRSFVTDSSVSTFGTTVAGGGSTKVPVYSDGTNWKVG